MPNAKAKRTPKTSSGAGIKHKRNKQTPLALILMGKGIYRNIDKTIKK